jgi:hypothetical protein
MKTIKATSLRIPASVFGLALMIGTPVQAQSRFPRLPFAEARAPRVAGSEGHFRGSGLDGDLRTLVQERLQQVHDLGTLKKLVAQFQRDPAHFRLDAEMIERLNNPEFRKLLEQWQRPAGQQEPPLEQLVRLQKMTEAILQAEAAAPRPPPPAASAAVPLPADSLTQWTERVLRQVDDSSWDRLRESPAFRRAAEQMKSALGAASPEAHAAVERWLGGMLPKDLSWEAGEKLLRRLEELEVPERWQVPWPSWARLPASLPEIGGLPAPPRALSERSFGWLLLALGILVGWRAWLRRAAARAVVSPRLGALVPENVTTRTELIAAFDRLALAKLGPRARSWNHRVVAERWTDQAAASAVPARLLADLYETARYTAGPDALSHDEAAQAQTALQRLRTGASA